MKSVIKRLIIEIEGNGYPDSIQAMNATINWGELTMDRLISSLVHKIEIGEVEPKMFLQYSRELQDKVDWYVASRLHKIVKMDMIMEFGNDVSH